ncbi:hypothetical protein [Synechococcus sp. CCY 0621]|uniref:hypothetical protein n=1 Tax=Synechococcus sp. CCY 0621 TaxID=2815603 RepID=UPI001C246E6E|nr:hypothetical protein [Synechococcus sp. CCY 0621]
MVHPVASTAGQSRSASLLQRLSHWLSETINHAWGNPGEEAQHRPPAIGEQPFTGDPTGRRRR